MAVKVLAPHRTKHCILLKQQQVSVRAKHYVMTEFESMASQTNAIYL